MPAVGLGTFLIKDEKTCTQIIEKALEVGYRHFDTAVIYENHKLLGATFKKIFS